MRCFGIELDDSVIGRIREAAEAAGQERDGWRDLVGALPPACRPAKETARLGQVPGSAGHAAERLPVIADFIARKIRERLAGSPR